MKRPVIHRYETPAPGSFQRVPIGKSAKILGLRQDGSLYVMKDLAEDEEAAMLVMETAGTGIEIKGDHYCTPEAYVGTYSNNPNTPMPFWWHVFAKIVRNTDAQG